MENFVLRIQRRVIPSASVTGAPLRALLKDSLCNKEVSIGHAGHLLPENYGVILKVKAIVLIDQVPIDSFDLDVDQVFYVSRLLELVLVNLGDTFILL